jgi:hypothetical protein
VPARPLPQESVELLDLDLAWRRVKADVGERGFVVHPWLTAWLDSDLSTHLDQIRTEIRAGYQPAAARRCWEPKAGWLLRSGAVLEPRDEIVYAAVVGGLLPQIRGRLQSMGGEQPEVAYPLRGTDRAVPPVARGWRVWDTWRQRSLEALDAGSHFVTQADIAGCYDNIDLGRLRSDLRGLGSNDALLELLFYCLNRWAEPRAKGIPQGHTSSDILAKLYMDPIDRAIRNAGYVHLRYVDDVRIFCRDGLQAKRALVLLLELAHHRGLTLQSAKTRILDREAARITIDGVAPVVQALHVQVRTELEALAARLGPYATPDDVEEYLSLSADEGRMEVVERAFRDHFADRPFADEPSKTLLHYLLARLGTYRSRTAVQYALELVRRKPEETTFALRYLSAVGITEDERASLVDYLQSPECLYDHQNYEILRWFWLQGSFPDPLVGLCRAWAFDRNRSSWLRTYALCVLGAVGDPADLERIEASYGAADSDVERAEVVMALSRMEHGRRNAFFARAEADGPLVRAAVRQARV